MAVGMGSRKRTPVPASGVPMEVSYINSPHSTHSSASPSYQPSAAPTSHVSHGSTSHLPTYVTHGSTTYLPNAAPTSSSYILQPFTSYLPSNAAPMYASPAAFEGSAMMPSPFETAMPSMSDFDLSPEQRGLSLNVLPYGSSLVAMPLPDNATAPQDPVPALSWPDRHTLVRWLPGMVQVLLANVLLVLLMATYVYHRELQNGAGEVVSLTRQLGGLQAEMLTGRREKELSSVDTNWLLHKQTLAHNQLDALQDRHDDLLELVVASEAHTKELKESHRAVLERLQATEADTLLVRQQLALTWRRLRELLGSGRDVRSIEDRAAYWL